MQRSKITPSTACLILSVLFAAIFFNGLLVEGRVYLLVPFYFVGALWAARIFWKKSKANTGDIGHNSG